MVFCPPGIDVVVPWSSADLCPLTGQKRTFSNTTQNYSNGLLIAGDQETTSLREAGTA